MSLHLEPLEPCDCRRMTVLRQDGVPTCHRCQRAQREFAQTWVGQEPPVFKMDELIRRAYTHPTEVIASRRLREAYEHDVALKHAMSSMRYDEYRRLHPHRSKQDLIDHE